jgi:microcystin-dependent protein
LAQNDYIIDNQTAPNSRADLNNVFQAIVSNNSGTSAPTVTYANMIWYDTTNKLLRMRSEADDAWITLGTLDQVANTFAPANAVPAGAVVYLARSSAPDGWLKANGATVSRSTYAQLFSAIGTTFGAGNGSTTFRLPDLRGEFLRGWDDGRGIDSGRAFGSFQSDEFKSHSHNLNRTSGFGSGSVSRLLRENLVNAVTEGTTSVGGNETRPRNRALLACIKF